MAPSCFEVILVGFILLPFFYETSRTFRYYFKFLVFCSSLMLVSLMLLPVLSLRPGNVRNFALGAMFCQFVNVLLGLRWELRGTEHLEKEKACVIVSNHQSSLDVLGLFKMWLVMDKCTIVSKKEVFYAWPFGLAAWLCGLIFIDRMNSEKARSVLNNAAEELKKKKVKLWVFPEGTRYNTGEIHPFKKGAFQVAIRSQLPIQPVVFSSYYFLSAEEKRFDSGHILVTILPPISTEGLNLDDVQELMEKTQSIISEVFHTTSQHETQSVTTNKPCSERPPSGELSDSQNFH